MLGGGGVVVGSPVVGLGGGLRVGIELGGGLGPVPVLRFWRPGTKNENEALFR